MAQHGHLCINPAFVHLSIFTLLKYILWLICVVGKNCWFGWKGWLVGMLSPVLQIFLSVSGGLSGRKGKWAQTAH